MNPRWSPVLLLAVVALVVGGLVVVDLAMPSDATERPGPVAAGPAVGGAWYCAAGAVDGDDELAVLTAAPPDQSNPSDTEVVALDGDATRVAVNPVFPGSARLTELVDVRGEVGASVRWFDEPSAVSRVWRRTQAEGPDGIVAGPCASAPSPTWYVPGMSTAGGSRAELYLANPFATDASVSIEFTTPAGPEAPILLENVSVPATSVEVVDLNEFVPRQADLGVTVRTRSGRVVVEGVQALDAAIGGVDATALVRAAPQLDTTWTIPWSLTDPAADPVPPAEEPTEGEPTEDVTDEATEDVTDEPTEPTEAPEADELLGPTGGSLTSTDSPGGGTASWIWVSNPGEDQAAVTVTLHTDQGPVVPDIGDELLIEPGRILRIDMRGLLPPGLSAAGATVRAENDVPVVAGVGTLLAPEGGVDGAGYTAQLGWPGPDATWVVAGEPSRGRTQVLHVVNPGADAAVVDVALWNGAVLRTPTALQGVEVPAGALVEMDVSELLADADQVVAFVTATEGEVVAGRHSVGGEIADWIAHAGVPSRLWSGGDVVPPVDQDDELLDRLGTSGGLPSPQPGAVDPSPSPTPSPTLPTELPTTEAPAPAPTGTDGSS